MSTAILNIDKKMALIPKLRFPEFEDKWELKKILDFAPLQRGFDLPVNDIKQGKYPVVFSNGILKTHNEFKAKAPGVVTGRSGTIGKVTFIEQDYWPHNTSLWVTDFKNNDPKYVYFFYSNFKLERLGTGSSVPTLNRNDVHAKKAFFPTLPEQQKIASFLSAVDEKTQQLSRKKELLEQYKKGVMQQLFSGKLRFKDENGTDYADWEEKKLGEVCEIIGGGTPDTNISEYWGGEIQWFTPTEIKSDFVSNSIRTITELGLQKSSAKKLPIGTILLTTRATIGEVSIAIKECSTNQGFQSLIVKKENSNVFIFNWIKKNKYELISRANGSTFPEISKSAIEKISLKVPSFPEQQKIANFLTRIDVKIESTNQQIHQMQSFKKGLLQQLFV